MGVGGQDKKKKVVFIGASRFGLRCLQRIIQSPKIQISGVVTAPERFQISYAPDGVTNVLHADIASFALNKAIPVAILKNRMTDELLFNQVACWEPDAFVVAGWYHMIPKRWRDLAPAYGLHASLLPDYSGGAPLVWAMINGETKTGITLFQMNDGVDTGPIVGQIEEQIRSDDTIATLYARIEDRGIELIESFLPKLANESFELRQQSSEGRRIMPQRSPTDGVIDWRGNAEAIDRFVRAQTQPYPGAYSFLRGEPLHIWQTEVLQGFPVGKGCVGLIQRMEQNSYYVTCGQGVLKLKEVSYRKVIYMESSMAVLFKDGDILQ